MALRRWFFFVYFFKPYTTYKRNVTFDLSILFNTEQNVHIYIVNGFRSVYSIYVSEKVSQKIGIRTEYPIYHSQTVNTIFIEQWLPN